MVTTAWRAVKTIRTLVRREMLARAKTGRKKKVILDKIRILLPLLCFKQLRITPKSNLKWITRVFFGLTSAATFPAIFVQRSNIFPRFWCNGLIFSRACHCSHMFSRVWQQLPVLMRLVPFTFWFEALIGSSWYLLYYCDCSYVIPLLLASRTVLSLAKWRCKRKAKRNTNLCLKMAVKRRWNLRNGFMYDDTDKPCYQAKDISAKKIKQLCRKAAK